MPKREQGYNNIDNLLIKGLILINKRQY